MAKKVIFSFSGVPTVNTGLNILINFNGLPLYFIAGGTNIEIEYLANGTPDEPPTRVETQLTLNTTIDKTLSFLNTYYYNDAVSYKRVNNTIEMLVNLDDIEIILSTNTPQLVFTVEDVDPNNNLNLKYFFQYTNSVNDLFLCQIFKKQYFDTPIEINGSATLDKGSVKNHTDSTRGTGLSIDLEANVNLTFEDLYTENEQDYTVIFYKNNQILFRGFLKPDGVFQSYTRDEWIISLDCVDGLGTLENLSFVKDNGLRYVGKLKVIDIIYNCLKRTGIVMPINTSINVNYNGFVGNDILDNIYLLSDRFFKEDSQGTGDGTLMSCEEVLKSVLGIFRANITQENGEWYIYKADEIYNNTNVSFNRYNVNNVYVGNKNINLAKEIGSQIDNYYPHFAGGDQKIKIEGSISAFRLGYKYGFLNGLLPNGILTRTGTDFNLWTENAPAIPFIINDPQIPNGLIIKSQGLSDPDLLVLTSTAIAVDLGDKFDFKVNATITGGQVTFGFRIKIGGNYLNNNGIWSTDPNTFFTPTIGEVSGNIEDIFVEKSASFILSTAPAPISGNLIVEIYRPFFGIFIPGITYRPNAIIRSVDITTNSAELNGKVGEFHTVQRANRTSSLIKENDTVIIGDETDNFYSGSIFKNNQTETTSLWSRKGAFENYPLLRISAETELRLGQKPLKLFSGSLYGYIPYLSIISINNLQGKFMPIKYVYDTKANKTTFDLLELIADEISDINYTFTIDYGNTVKPTIVG
jgi:hypothetical protein